MKKINVNLKSRSYPIIVGPLNNGIKKEIRSVLPFAPTKIFLVSSPRVAKAGHVKRVEKVLNGLAPLSTCLISDGELQKNINTLLKLYQQSFQSQLDRRSLVVVVGGGVLTDLVGLFAATFMRGISYISIPTTLLAMVDAAIGGKTAIDLPQGKNLLGIFWQPSLVWNDPSFLGTLPVREWKTGMAEVSKYGIIRDVHFFKWLEDRVRINPNPLRWKRAEVEKMIFVSAAIKADVVSRDETETPLRGGREILNFGHTIGHALEAATGYKKLTHGEAISIGMVAVGRMALKMGTWSEDAQLRLLTLLDAIGLPLEMPRLSASEQRTFWKALSTDKKHIGGKLRFVIPQKIGLVRVQSGIPLSLIKSSLR